MDRDAREKVVFMVYFTVFVGAGVLMPMDGWLQTAVTILVLFTLWTAVYLVVLRLVFRGSSSPSELD